MLRWLLRLIASYALIWGLASPALAQDTAPDEPAPSAEEQEARALFISGRDAFNDGRFDDALEHFERSYELSRRPELLFNIGTSADRLRLNERALRAFEQYLEALPDAPNRREVEGRIRVLRSVPTPAETAAAAPASEEPAVVVVEDDGSVLETWWFWTLVGAVVAGGVVAAILLTRDSDPDYQLGDDGTVHLTLLEAP